MGIVHSVGSNGFQVAYRGSDSGNGFDWEWRIDSISSVLSGARAVAVNSAISLSFAPGSAYALSKMLFQPLTDRSDLKTYPTKYKATYGPMINTIIKGFPNHSHLSTTKETNCTNTSKPQ